MRINALLLLLFLIINNCNKWIMPCCRCNGRNAVCKGCSCVRKKIACSDCYPCRQGKCMNLTTSSQQLSSTSALPLRILSSTSVASNSDDLPPPVSASPQLLSPLSHSQQLSASPSLPSTHSQQLPATPPQQPHAVPISPQSPPALSLCSSSHHSSPPPRQPSSPTPSPEQPILLRVLQQHLDHELSLPPTPGFSSTTPQASSSGLSSTTHQGSSSGHFSTTHQTLSSGIPSSRKQCTVDGCPAQIAPSMWHNHMTLHAKGALPGSVPSEWLRVQNVFVCPSCSQLVSNSRQASHLRQCPMRSITSVSLQRPVPTPSSDISHNLPTFEEVCQLNHPTLRYIPAKARPAFAKAVSSALRDRILKRHG